MAKLSEAMSTALYRIHDHAWSGANPRTVEALIKRGLLVQEADRPVLTDAGRKAIGVEDIAPGESIEVTGSYAGGHSQEQILELLGEDAPESDEAPIIPFFNRKALRDLRREEARYNRRMMREQGKRRRKYGADDPKYFRRKHMRMMAETSDLAAA